MFYNISNTLSVMLEFPICKKSTDIESASNKLEERKSLITDPRNEKWILLTKVSLHLQ